MSKKRDLMSLEQLKQILAERGFSIVLRNGQPALHGPRAQATPALMRVIGFYRDVLISELKGGKCAQGSNSENVRQGR